MLNQVSVFTENTKGALRKMTSVLADANINIYTMLANDTQNSASSASSSPIRNWLSRNCRKPATNVIWTKSSPSKWAIRRAVWTKSSTASARPIFPLTTCIFLITARPAHRSPSSRLAKWKRKRSCAVKDMYCWILFKKNRCRTYDSDFFLVVRG